MSRPDRRPLEKVRTLPELLRDLASVRERRRTIVFTNGCYDLLHVGHLDLLEQAAALGDVLVIGLNGDDSVRRLKGEGRPLVPFAERAELLAGFDVVDWVVGFDEDTPAALIEALEPDVLVKGGDWAPDAIVGRETVERRGGRVLSVPLRPGRSTSALLERIRKGDGGGESTAAGEPAGAPAHGDPE